MAKKGVLLTDKDENFLYPQTILEMVTNKDQSATLDVLLQVLRENLESSIENTNLNVSNLRDELSALLSDVTLSGEVRDAILEINSLLNSGSSDITSEVVTSIRQLKEDAVLHSEQSLTSSQKKQARKNVDAVGVVTTYGDGGSWATLSYNDNTIYPETKGKQVKMSNGSNVEDAINTNTSNISANTENIKEKIGLVGSPTVENGVQSGTLGYKNQPFFPTTRDNKVFVQSKSRTLDVVINDIETDISKEETRAQQVEMYLESQKADKTGYYENLSVGVSDNLSGRGEATDSEFAMRPSGGENKSIEDGTARINTIKGNSVVYNQFVNSFNRVVDKQAADKFDYEITSDEIILTCHTGGVPENAYLFGLPLGANISVNDKVYASIECKSSFDCSIRVFPAYNTIGIFNPNSVYKKYSFVGTINKVSSGSYILYILFNTFEGLLLNVGDEIRFKKPQLTNLTKMFNGVNVPTTVEEFEALYGNMPNEYNERGTIVDNHTTAIKSVGVNAWDEEITFATIGVESGNVSSNPERIASKNFCACIGGAKYYVSKPTEVDLNLLWYDKDKNYISFNYCHGFNEHTAPTNARFFKINLYHTYGTTYNHDICIHLVHTGYLNGRYFPYESQIRQLPTVEGGLKSAGTAYDEIRYNKGKDKWEHVQRIGSVDLGTLEWTILNEDDTVGYRFIAKIPNDCKNLNDYNILGNILCSKYGTATAGNTWGGRRGVSLYNYQFLIKDTNYTDATTFKQAMQGVILYYELATPTVTELDIDFSPDYKVWDYGTEEAISEVLSTPVRINANYGFNAVGQITDNTELIKELLARVAVLEAQLTQQTSMVASMQDANE